MFSVREPRKFRRVSIYTDERRDKLDKLVSDYKKETGQIPVSQVDYTEDRFKGKFSQFTPRAQRFAQGGRGLIKWPVALVLILLLYLLIRWILTGEARF